MLANQTGLSNKYVSERHHFASKNKMTAGEASKLLKKQKINYSAKDIIKAFKIIKGFEPEWHHAGFYKNNNKSTMGRTFFFTNEEIQEIVTNQNMINEKLELEKNNILKMNENIIYGFYYIWDYNYSGQYGKKRNFKKLTWYEGNELNKPKNLTVCEKEFFEKYKHITASYYGWDEPSIYNIQNKI
jgi:hypothetical protein